MHLPQVVVARHARELVGEYYTAEPGLFPRDPGGGSSPLAVLVQASPVGCLADDLLFSMSALPVVCICRLGAVVSAAKDDHFCHIRCLNIN
jgi:hypothetical protein